MALCSRRDFLRSACVAGVACFGAKAWGAPERRRPNFLFILADDEAPFTLKAYGNTVCHTPNLDRLSAEGMTLDGAYHMGSWSGAVCMPSRTMMMTGRTVWHIPGKGNPNNDNPALVPPDLAEYSLPAVFNRAGYDTFRTCKVGNSYPPANERFKTNIEKTCREGNDEQGSKWHADNVLEYLDKRVKTGSEEPFLIYLGFSHPHDPRNGRPEYLGEYGAINAIDPDAQPNPGAPPLPANYLPAHPFDHGHPDLRDEVAVQGVMKSRAEAVVRNEIGREYACIENIDEQVGRVLAKLEAMGELDHTYVIYTADHGISVGRHGLMGKQNLYQHTWRVPYIVRGPGIAAGSRAAGNIYLLDLLPTLCDLAGVEIPTTVEGLSFRPVLEGKAPIIREVMYGAYAGGTKPGMRCVQKGPWKLIKYDTLSGKVQETQLFNLDENPWEFLPEHRREDVVALTGARPAPEQTDLAEDPRYKAKREELEALLRIEQRWLDDPFCLWDQ